MKIYPLSILPGVGTYWQTKLKKLTINNITDLLLHLPIRYVDKTKLVSINSAILGEFALIEGEIINQTILRGKKRRLQITVTDNSGSINLLFFNFSNWIQEKLKVGEKIRCFGQIGFTEHCKQIIHPEYKIINKDKAQPISTVLTPIYYLTQGLQQSRLQNFTKLALETYKQQPLPEINIEFLPPKIKFTWLDSIENLHFPIPKVDLNNLTLYNSRLAFEELLAHHLQMRINKKNRTACLAKTISQTRNLVHKLRAILPFTPTAEQEKVYQEIERDLSSTTPMFRLVQGDVGCGKTLIAALSSLLIIESGYQVALLVPTEILAKQHLTTFTTWFAPLNIVVRSLSGGKQKQKPQILHDLKNNTINLLIGTHALLQPNVEFNNLGLIIIDEQHRFGVEQRNILAKKTTINNTMAHQLILSATPIPRTLAQTFYADLDLSNILTLPCGRKTTITIVTNNKHRAEIIKKIEKLCAAEAQVYWICPAINEQDNNQTSSAEEIYKILKNFLPSTPIALIHSKILRNKQEQIMQEFQTGKLKIIVATTVIEVGIDVPNATIIVIENSERFGLAQLHQLRGRVGRSDKQSYCILLYNEPLPTYARARLLAIRKHVSGFHIAEEDLKLRGPGELFGNKQSGDFNFKIADLHRDQHLLPNLANTANIIEKNQPEIIPTLIERWLHTTNSNNNL